MAWGGSNSFARDVYISTKRDDRQHPGICAPMVSPMASGSQALDGNPIRRQSHENHAHANHDSSIGRQDGRPHFYGGNGENPQSRDIQRVFGLSDGRFGVTVSGESMMRLSQFAEFKRNVSGGERYKDFWSVFSRAIAKLKSLGLSMEY